MDEINTPEAPEGTVGPIGICLSGGGYRAAAFHLGALSYLQHLGLDADLTMLSTVSGGTFTGTRYAVSQATREPFEDFFKGFYNFLEQTDLVKLGLRRLAEGGVEVPSGRQDLIISVAEIYAETFLSNANGEPYQFGDVLDAIEEKRVPLREVVFNTTEFRHGIDFRFQSSGRVGNGRVSIDRDVAKKLRLADITAMSSCFPGGFEPVAFPFDVHWPGGKVPRDIGDAFYTAEGDPRPLPIMDGGIYDNQGLDALMMANKRADYPLETVIISDVDQIDDDLYPYPEVDTPQGPTLNLVVWLGRVLALLSALTFLVLGWKLVDDIKSSADLVEILVDVTSVFLSGVTFLALYWLRREAMSALARLPQVGRHAWKDLRRLKVEQLAQMLLLRAGSLLALTSNVFPKRVRNLVFRRFFSDQRFQSKLVSNLIYKLTLDRERRKLEKIPGVKVPSADSDLYRVAQASATMATTLWFVEGKGWCQPSLVASGQATLVYSLLENLYRRYDGIPTRGEAAELWPRLIDDMKRFLDDPYWLLSSLRPGDYPVPPPDCSCADALTPVERSARL